MGLIQFFEGGVKMLPTFNETLSRSTNKLAEVVKIARRMEYPIYLLPDFGTGKVKVVKTRSEQELKDVYPGLLARSEMNQITIKKPVFVQ